MVNKRLLTGLKRLRRCFKPKPRRLAKRPSPEKALVPVPATKEALRTYFDIPVNWVSPWLDVAAKRTASAQFGKEWESFEKRHQRYLEADEAPILPDRNKPCPLMWLPIEIRVKIWKYVFDANAQGLVLKNDGISSRPSYPMRLISCLWADETWSAYLYALATRTLVVLDYPEHGYLEMPCPILTDLDGIRLRAIKFVLGDKIPIKADLRNREFISFMLSHRDFGLFNARTVIIEFKENWVTSAFDEISIADLLKCSFYGIERVRIYGLITATKVDRLLKRLRTA